MVKAKSSGGNFKAVKLPQPGTTVAICYSMIHIGTIPNFMDQSKKDDKIILTWELPQYKAIFNEEEGIPKPFVVSEELTLSTNDKSNLSKLVGAWRGKPFTPEEKLGFDPSVFVGKSCLINFAIKNKKAHADTPMGQQTNETSFLKMVSVISKPKEMEVPAQTNPNFIWDWEKIESEGWDQTSWEAIPNFLKDKIKTSEEFIKFAPDSVRNPQADGADTANTAQAPIEEPTQDAGPVSEDGW
jgi:hypothetical protein